MKKSVLGFAAVLLFVFAMPQTATAEAKWEFLGKYDDVKTWSKEVKGQDVFAFKGEFVANVHIGKILTVFVDSKHRKHWVDRYEAHHTLEKVPGSQTYRIHFGLPFPISDRDYVLKSDGFPDAEKGVYTCKIKSVTNKKAPKNDCCVRARAYGTYYRFEALKTPEGKEQTKVFVEVHTDPKGMLPSWLVNIIQKKWPSKTLSGLVKHARKHNVIDPKYADWHKERPVAAAPVAAPVEAAKPEATEAATPEATPAEPAAPAAPAAPQ